MYATFIDKLHLYIDLIDVVIAQLLVLKTAHSVAVDTNYVLSERLDAI